MSTQSHSCPDSITWQFFLDGTISAEDRPVAESHLARCRHCRERLIALYDNAEEARFQETAPPALTHRVTKAPVHWLHALRPYVPLALAASVVIAVGFSIFVYRDTRSTSKPPQTDDLRRSNGATNDLPLASPPNGAHLHPGPVEFRWTDAGNGARYEFTVTDERGDIIVQEKLTTTSLVIDIAKLQLSSRQHYYWSVSARLPDGASRTSVIAGFTLR